MSTINLDGVSNSSDLAAATAAAPATQELGQEAFLNLLVTQLQYQDPLNPQENEEFIAQLAQFSQVEQLTNANTALGNVYQAIASMNNASMTQLLGKTVKAFGDEFHYSGDGEVELHYDAATDAAGATLTVHDESGSVVYTTEIGALTDGEGRVTWTGNLSSGGSADEGTYTFSVTGRDSDGDPVDVQEIIEGEIDAMSFESGSPVPSIGGVDVNLGDIIHVSTGTSEQDRRADDGDDNGRRNRS